MAASRTNYLLDILVCTLTIFLYLQPPFFGGNRDKIQQKIVKEKMKLPTYLSSEVHSLLKGVSLPCSPCAHVFCATYPMLVFKVNQFEFDQTPDSAR